MGSVRRTTLSVVLGLAVIGNVIAKDDPQAKISPFLRRAMAKKAVRAELSALVIMKEKADIKGAAELSDRNEKAKFVYQALAQVASSSQQDLVQYLTTNNVNFRRFYITNMIALYEAAPAVINEIAARADVEKIIANPLINSLPPVTKAAPTKGKRDVGIEGSLISIGADKVWSDLHVNGSGIVIAGQDTGVDVSHPALKGSYRGTDGDTVNNDFNWHDSIHEAITSGSNPCGFESEKPCDDNAHGTHTVGTVLGDDHVGNQVGVAPGAKWVACRNMDRGTGRPSTYIECFEWFLAPYAKGTDPLVDGKPELAPHVINNSWGCPPDEGCHESEFVPVLAAMKAAGIMVVASAGNDGPGCSTIKDPPAMHSLDTFSVGAHNHRNGEIASFSSRGPSKDDGQVGPDITAPGVNIRSAIPGGTYSGASWSGTSMAGPHVVGLVALIWSAKPELIGKIEETEALIRATATPTTSTQTCGGVAGTEIPNNTFGYGRINAYKAVATAMGRVVE